MRFELLIAKKFMLGGSGSGPSRLNGWVSIIGMIIGTFAILISLSVMNGFEERVIKKLIGFEGDLRIASSPDTNLDKVYNQIISDPLVDKALLYKERVGLILSKDNSKRIVTFKSINMDKLSSFYNIDYINNAKVKSEKGVALGYLLAQRLNIDVVDQLTLMSPVDQ